MQSLDRYLKEKTRAISQIAQDLRVITKEPDRDSQRLEAFHSRYCLPKDTQPR